MKPPRVLLIAFEDWNSTARLPETLHRAGFEVGIISEPRNLAAQSRHIAERFALDVPAIRRGDLAAVVAALEAFAPEMIVPADERGMRVLRFLADAPAIRERPFLRHVVMRSTGTAEAARHTGERFPMLELASRLGIACAPHARVDGRRDAIAFGKRHGWPVYMKNDHTYGGQGVWRCDGAVDVRAAYDAFSNGHRLWSLHGLWRRGRRFLSRLGGRRDPLALPIGTRGISIEAAIEGRPAFYTGVALDGRLLAGFAAEVEVFHPPPTGPSARIRLHHDEVMARAASRLVDALGHNGFFGLDFIRRPDGGLVFLEFNGRPTTGVHLGELVSADLGLALFAALDGKSLPVPESPGEARVALFPQDWIRDPHASDRGEFHLDIPRDDPPLLAALCSRLPEGANRAEIERLSRAVATEGARA